MSDIFETLPDAPALAPYLLRPLGDRESGLGAEIIQLLMNSGADAETGEIALTCAVAMWAQQRAYMPDHTALQRLVNNASNLVATGRFALKVGEDFVRMVQAEIESGRRTLTQATKFETAEPEASGKIISLGVRPPK